MPQERLPMRKIRDVLRLKAGGSSKRKIAASLGISPTAVGECIRRARRACLSWPLPTWTGAKWATRLKSETLCRVIAVLLVIIAAVLPFAHETEAGAPALTGGCNSGSE